MLLSILKSSQKAFCFTGQLNILSSKLISNSIYRRSSVIPLSISKSTVSETLKIPQKMSEFVFPNDQPVVKLDCEKAFNALTEKEKLYAHYMSRACWYGGLIVLAQTSSESPLIYVLLQKLFRAETISELRKRAISKCDFTEDEFTALLVYTCGILSNMGNYKGFGDKKFVPNLPKEKITKLVLGSKAADLQHNEVIMVLSNCIEQIFSLEDGVKQLGFPDVGITTYLSKNFTREDSDLINRFMKERNIEPWNTRVFKSLDETTGKTCYEIRVASAIPSDNMEDEFFGSHNVNGHKISITRGDYSQLLSLVNKSLTEAKKYAANEKEVNMIDGYIHSFKTGLVESHKNGSRHWVKNRSPIVETYIGFVETYRDPTGARAEFEGFVAMVNKPMSAKFEELVRQAENFLPMLPWPSSYEKDKFLKPDFTSLDVLTFAGSIIPNGICIPNYTTIRQNEGFKNVSLGNVIMGTAKVKNINYLNEEDEQLIQKHKIGTYEAHIGLHELLGHGSGKLFIKAKDGSFNFDQSTVLDLETGAQIDKCYEEGETFYAVFGPISSAYEECRAECVGLYLSVVPAILKIFGYEGAEAEDITYVNWLNMCRLGIEQLQMYEPETQSWLQAHSQARYVILRALLAAGEDFLRIEAVEGKDGKPDLLLSMDRSKILSVGKPAIGTFLQRLQLYRSTANVEKAKEMFNKFSEVTAEGPNPFLKYREIVMARMKPRQMVIQANTIIKDEKVVLKTYEQSHEGMVQSWLERFEDNEVDTILMELWKKDEPHFASKNV